MITGIMGAEPGIIFEDKQDLINSYSEIRLSNNAD